MPTRGWLWLLEREFASHEPVYAGERDLAVVGEVDGGIGAGLPLGQVLYRGYAGERGQVDLVLVSVAEVGDLVFSVPALKLENVRAAVAGQGVIALAADYM